VRFLLDQNVPIGLGRWLQRQSPDWEVFDAKQQRLWGKSDAMVMTRARELGAILITFDRDFASDKPLRPEQPAVICLCAHPTTQATAERLLQPLLQKPGALTDSQRIQLR
jgi:predicted nuclease of predicted toxin-antitoxin system